MRTFGCQMNEHDSERIAGLLEADGLTEATSMDEADVVVLNTCCIRENADNKLYGHLGALKTLKDANPNLEIVVGGCLAQKDRDQIQQRAGHVDVVVGTHNVHRTVDLLAQARVEGPLTEIWALPVPAGGVAGPVTNVGVIGPSGLVSCQNDHFDGSAGLTVRRSTTVVTGVYVGPGLVTIVAIGVKLFQHPGSFWSTLKPSAGTAGDGWQ